MRRPFAIGIAAQYPAFECRLQKTIGFALVERLFAQFLVGVLAFERRVAERPEERMVGNQAVQCKPDMMTEAGPLVVQLP